MYTYKAKAPGSLMLLGEHAVLEHGPALVCAINQYVHVDLTPRLDTSIRIRSALGTYQTQLSQLEIVPPFTFILSALKKWRNQMTTGCDIDIRADFTAQMGLASSSAVTVATVLAIKNWLGVTLDKMELLFSAREIVQSVQGMGSGADVAASIWGGTVHYRLPNWVEQVPLCAPITVLYSGNKTKTVDVLAHVEQTFAQWPTLKKQLLLAIADCAAQGIEAAKQKKAPELGHLMNIQQGLMDALGVNTPLLTQLVDLLRQQSSVTGAKISGSGLGDCVVACGEAPLLDLSSWTDKGVKRLNVMITEQGADCEKN